MRNRKLRKLFSVFMVIFLMTTSLHLGANRAFADEGEVLETSYQEEGPTDLLESDLEEVPPEEINENPVADAMENDNLPDNNLIEDPLVEDLEEPPLEEEVPLESEAEIQDEPMVEEPIKEEAQPPVEPKIAEEPNVELRPEDAPDFNPDNLLFPAEITEPINYYIPPVTKARGSLNSIMPMANGELSPGEARFTKTAEVVNGMVNTWDITVRLEARNTQTTSDIILVIDRSGSMSGTKLSNAKTAAVQFINNLLPTDNTLNRIAIVTFASDVNLRHDFTGASNRQALINTVNGLSASGGTHTQAAMHQANALYSTSTADNKFIVLLSDGQPTFSHALSNPGNYLSSQYIGTASPGGFSNTHVVNGNRQATTANAPASAYNYGSSVGTGSQMFHRYDNPQGTSNDKYYNHGNSAIAEAGYAKANFTVYTIALEAGAIGTPVLNAMASPGKSYTATASELTTIFNEIAGSITGVINDGVLLDEMGDGFQVPSGEIANINVTQGTATYNSALRKIDWVLGGPLNQYVTVGGDIRFAELKYRVEINDGILTASPTEVNGTLFETNKNTVISYTAPSGPINAPIQSPEVDPILLNVSKILLDNAGNPITTDDRLFDINVTGPNYNHTYQVKGGETKVLTNLRYVGDYTVSETAVGGASVSLSDYEISNNLTDSKFNVAMGTLTQVGDDINVVVTNKEKALGMLTVLKVFDNILSFNRSPFMMGIMSTVLSFDFIVTGPNEYSQTFSLGAGENHVLENLVYGEYTVLETTTGFTTTYNPVDGKVNLSIDNKEATVTVTNKVTQNIDVTATKVWVGGETSHPVVWFKLYRSIDDLDPVAVSESVAEPKKLEPGVTTVTWENQTQYDENGKEYIYSVREFINFGTDATPDLRLGAPAFYTKLEVGLTVTNTYSEPPESDNTTFVVVNKEWVGVPSGFNPVTHFELYDEDAPSVIVATGSISYPDTTFIFNGVPATKLVADDPVKINYAVRELPLASFVSTPGVKTEKTIEVIKVPDGTDPAAWQFAFNPTFIVTKAEGSDTTIIWTLETIPEVDKDLFLLKFKEAAEGLDISPFDSITTSHSIIWLAGPNATADVKPDDPLSGAISLNILFNSDGTISSDSTLTFEDADLWTKFVVGSHYPLKYSFTNTYTPDKATAQIAVQKNLTGREWLPGDSFTFNLTGMVDGLSVSRSVNVSNGNVTNFDSIVFTQADSYVFTITEVKGSIPGVTYDTASKTVTVEVRDNGMGSLVASVSPTLITFNNAYDADGKAQFEITKFLDGRPLLGNEFKFELYKGASLLDTKSNLANGSVIFDVIEYELGDIGTHTYTIKEIQENTLSGVTYSDKVIDVTVLVTDNGDGTLQTLVTYSPDAIITNTYRSTNGNGTISGTKSLEGRTLAEGEFTFELYESDINGFVAADATPIDTTTNVGSDFSFNLTFGWDEDGTYYYVVREQAGSIGGVSYDDSQFLYIVNVHDNLTGQMIVEVTPPEDTEFNNEYLADDGEGIIAGTKELTGRDLIDGEFAFELYLSDINGLVAADATPIDTTTNVGQDFSFTLLYKDGQEGTYYYVVRERNDSLGGVTYDDSEFWYTIIVTDNLEGQMVANVINPDFTTFYNTYTPNPIGVELEGHKELEGRPLLADEFEFELYASNNEFELLGDSLEDVTNMADGSVSFSEIEFNEVGTYYFVIIEKVGGLAGIDYDETMIFVTIHVTDNLEGFLLAEVLYEDENNTFVNKYFPAPVRVILEGEKELIGRLLIDDLFEFELVNDKGTVIQKVANAGKKFSFELIFEEVGEFTFKIREVNGGLAHTTYDTQEFEVVITISDNLLGQLVAEIESEELVFTNTYKTNPSLSVEKSARLLNGSTHFTKVGDLIEFTVIATNTGDVELLNVEIVDDKEGLYDLQFHIEHIDKSTTDNVKNKEVTLLPGEKLVMVALYRVTQADLDELLVVNQATVKGYEPDPNDPEKPLDPDHPTTPEEPVEVEVPGRKLLPDTGSKRTINPIFSLFFVSAGAYLILKKREEE